MPVKFGTYFFGQNLNIVFLCRDPAMQTDELSQGMQYSVGVVCCQTFGVCLTAILLCFFCVLDLLSMRLSLVSNG
jgi:hypothetical protein